MTHLHPLAFPCYFFIHFLIKLFCRMVNLQVLHLSCSPNCNPASDCSTLLYLLFLILCHSEHTLLCRPMLIKYHCLTAACLCMQIIGRHTELCHACSEGEHWRLFKREVVRNIMDCRLLFNYLLKLAVHFICFFFIIVMWFNIVMMTTPAWTHGLYIGYISPCFMLFLVLPHSVTAQSLSVESHVRARRVWQWFELPLFCVRDLPGGPDNVSSPKNPHHTFKAYPLISVP